MSEPKITVIKQGMLAHIVGIHGLTPEQVAAIPRLVACFTAPDDMDEGRCEEHRREMDELERIFPRRTS